MILVCINFTKYNAGFLFTSEWKDGNMIMNLQSQLTVKHTSVRASAPRVENSGGFEGPEPLKGRIGATQLLHEPGLFTKRNSRRTLWPRAFDIDQEACGSPDWEVYFPRTLGYRMGGFNPG
jgi:hypothetical protein